METETNMVQIDRAVKSQKGRARRKRAIGRNQVDEDMENFVLSNDINHSIQSDAGDDIYNLKPTSHPLASSLHDSILSYSLEQINTHDHLSANYQFDHGNSNNGHILIKSSDSLPPTPPRDITILSNRVDTEYHTRSNKSKRSSFVADETPLPNRRPRLDPNGSCSATTTSSTPKRTPIQLSEKAENTGSSKSRYSSNSPPLSIRPPPVGRGKSDSMENYTCGTNYPRGTSIPVNGGSRLTPGSIVRFRSQVPVDAKLIPGVPEHDYFTSVQQVYYHFQKGEWRAVYGPSKNRQQKSFSVNKYGFYDAKRRAEEWRLHYIQNNYVKSDSNDKSNDIYGANSSRATNRNNCEVRGSNSLLGNSNYNRGKKADRRSKQLQNKSIALNINNQLHPQISNVAGVNIDLQENCRHLGPSVPQGNFSLPFMQLASDTLGSNIPSYLHYLNNSIQANPDEVRRQGCLSYPHSVNDDVHNYSEAEKQLAGNQKNDSVSNQVNNVKNQVSPNYSDNMLHIESMGGDNLSSISMNSPSDISVYISSRRNSYGYQSWNDHLYRTRKDEIEHDVKLMVPDRIENYSKCENSPSINAPRQIQSWDADEIVDSFFATPIPSTVSINEDVLNNSNVNDPLTCKGEETWNRVTLI